MAEFGDLPLFLLAVCRDAVSVVLDFGWLAVAADVIDSPFSVDTEAVASCVAELTDS